MAGGGQEVSAMAMVVLAVAGKNRKMKCRVVKKKMNNNSFI
jgi:hypothetical protein